MLRNLKHFVFWVLLFGLEIIAYKQNWGSKFWTFSSISMALALLLFYTCRLFTRKLIGKVQFSSLKRITSYRDFWYMCASVAFFVIARLYTDLVLLNAGNDISVLSYCLVILRIAASFAVPAFLLGLAETNKEIIALLKKKESELTLRISEAEARLFTLEEKEIHLNSIIEAKENTIKGLTAQVEELQFKEEMLARDIVALEACAEKLKQTNSELLERQAKLERSVAEQTALQEAYKRDKEVTDKIFFQTNRDWLAQVKRYQRILAFYNIPDDDGQLPGLN